MSAFAELRRRHPTARLLIAPRHPERFAAVADLVARAGLACARRTALPEGGWDGGDVLVLDTLGELAQVYPLATVVFVGGSLARAGGHNVLEPAVAGRAIIVGPHMENFREIADGVPGRGRPGAGAPMRAGLADVVVRLFDDAAARDALGARAQRIVARNRGALDRTVAALAGLLSTMNPRALLFPAGAAFGAAAALRTRLYADGILRVHALGGPVISVGNLAVGGRGKTPIVARVAALLRDSGQRVAILSRGYGGSSTGAPLLVSDGGSVLASADVAGDEPVLLARSLQGVIVAVARRRIEAGRLVEARFGPRGPRAGRRLPASRAAPRPRHRGPRGRGPDGAADAGRPPARAALGAGPRRRRAAVRPQRRPAPAGARRLADPALASPLAGLLLRRRAAAPDASPRLRRLRDRGPRAPGRRPVRAGMPRGGHRRCSGTITGSPPASSSPPPWRRAPPARTRW